MAGQILGIYFQIVVRIQLPKLAVDDVKVFIWEEICDLKVKVFTRQSNISCSCNHVTQIYIVLSGFVYSELEIQIIITENLKIETPLQEDSKSP